MHKKPTSYTSERLIKERAVGGKTVSNFKFEKRLARNGQAVF